MSDFLDFADDSLASWRDMAACKGNTETFWPLPNETAERFALRQDQCKAICRRCMVMAECREWAFQRSDEGIDLVLGGLSYHERIDKMGGRDLSGRRRPK